ncbi:MULTISPECIES: hypothetical protein [Bacillus amyloliquefaciens group]|uniref:hypothetical protein n=1 Tax=Bacillus amyloliquefaciens group TaxID=1938374 RepID=UPI00215030C3|nr:MULTISPECIES: hypothetical protein [Bacillus amyloliquefaciens group]MCR4367577.1 hypothetical protein [Bacillus amyloliquefaciens]MCV3200130.1 hypothetical protein [Bacillus velezensis]MDW0355538.1 hypothetical protein [Bacillus velezensis]MEE1864723.1 hypothetical protein [Bacillus velezensis]
MTSKKLNLGLIEESVSKYDKKEKVQLTDDVHVFIYPYFSPSRLSNLFKQILSDQKQAEEKGIDFKKINFVDWIAFSLIKEFVDLDIPNDIKNRVKWFHKLVESEFFPLILSSFPEESIKKLNEAAKMLHENIDKLSKMSPEEINDLILSKVEEIENSAE